MHINFEFKARHDDIDRLEKILKDRDPLFIGEDHQVDTYFNVTQGRLKMREGEIENALIFYERTNAAAAKQSDVTLYKHAADPTLKECLVKSMGVKIVVDKKRKIYFIDNVKFHFDRVNELGTFIEVEAIDKDGSMDIEELKKQCAFYEQLFQIKEEDMKSESYSDMMLAKKYSNREG